MFLFFFFLFFNFYYFYHYYLVIISSAALLSLLLLFHYYPSNHYPSPSHHNQSSNFYVILKHLHFSAEQRSFLNPCIFPTFPFSIFTIRLVPWGTTITRQLYDTMLCRRCSMPWSSSSSSSSSWLQLLFSFLLSLNTDILFYLGGKLGVRQTVCPTAFFIYISSLTKIILEQIKNSC